MDTAVKEINDFFNEIIDNELKNGFKQFGFNMVITGTDLKLKSLKMED